MKIALRVEGEITEDGHLVVDLPPELPRGRVAVTLEPLPAEDVEVTEADLAGAGWEGPVTAEMRLVEDLRLGGWGGIPGS